MVAEKVRQVQKEEKDKVCTDSKIQDGARPELAEEMENWECDKRGYLV